ncbi:uncharacterized protein [Atheta coriaria]|uniref:uncharacterized protein isoform X2 n=1 Tax=Dalotia coriaria TaxID=877792 RepID=UPI0031F3BCCC
MDGYVLHPCGFRSCGKKFTSLHDLIIHIEAMHIDFKTSYGGSDNHLKSSSVDTLGVMVPMSAILKYSEDDEIAEYLKSERAKREELAAGGEFTSPPIRPVSPPPMSPIPPLFTELNECVELHKPIPRKRLGKLPKEYTFKYSSKEFAFKCNNCPKSYKTYRALLAHHKVDHKEQPEPENPSIKSKLSPSVTSPTWSTSSSTASSASPSKLDNSEQILTNPFDNLNLNEGAFGPLRAPLSDASNVPMIDSATVSIACGPDPCAEYEEADENGWAVQN